MFTVSQALGPVTVNATASYVRGNKLNIVVTYISVNGAKKGSSNADALPVATGNCGSGGPIITLLPSYHFDNSVLNLKKASFFFSATYLGPSPGDPPCIVPPGGVSGVIGPVDVLPSGAEIPGYEYIGKILASGRWFLIAYSPEVGKTVTCERSFGNNGIVVFRTWDPISVNGMCY